MCLKFEFCLSDCQSCIEMLELENYDVTRVCGSMLECQCNLALLLACKMDILL